MGFGVSCLAGSSHCHLQRAAVWLLHRERGHMKIRSSLLTPWPHLPKHPSPRAAQGRPASHTCSHPPAPQMPVSSAQSSNPALNDPEKRLSRHQQACPGVKAGEQECWYSPASAQGSGGLCGCFLPLVPKGLVAHLANRWLANKEQHPPASAGCTNTSTLSEV